jgi:ABC-2 type transport system ATP-binding protein
MPGVTLNNLRKTYDKGKVVAVDDISLNIEEGELFGLIGPDGAGKTSIFRMLTTLLLPDGGSARVNDLDIVKDYEQIRIQVGYMPGRFSLYHDLTVKENLDFFATVFNTSIEENYKLIEDIYVQIEPFKNRRAGKLSGGMKQKLALCCALIHKPTVLFLDEPTTGVDAVSRKEFWEMLKRLKQQGITILVSTPYMDEANMCQRIALIQEGKILSVDTPKNIISRYPGELFSVAADDMIGLLHELRNISFIKSCYAFGSSHHVSLKGNLATGQSADADSEMLFQELNKKNYPGLRIERIEPTIEDCFIQFMTHKA